MKITDIKKIELEITSNCNASCPGCARTLNSENLKIQSFGLSELKNIFTNRYEIQNKEFKFCGVLGDPAMNSECLEMVRYLTDNGGYCELSTNGGVQPANWWGDLGEIAKKHPNLLHIHFCVDGYRETNHIYRVNTKFSVIERNMKAFSETAPLGHATWIYIIFDHNEHELEEAKNHAKNLGFNFATRTGMRNSYHDWLAIIKKKENNELKKEIKIITTTGDKEHSKKQEVQELDKFIDDYQKKKVSSIEKDEILKSIICKFVHEGEIFIASDLTVWPCCFLWDSAFKNKENILEKLSKFSEGWNSLLVHSLDEIINHPWYKSLLIESWNPENDLHLTRCVKTCAKNKAYHNEFNYIKI